MEARWAIPGGVAVGHPDSSRGTAITTAQVYSIDPLRDPRWQRLVLKHARASIFHTPAWLEALRRTYSYEPFVLTTCAPDSELQDGVVFCCVDSSLTGRRLVSVPFSDHCEPLVDGPERLRNLLASLSGNQGTQRFKYVEMRPVSSPVEAATGFEKANAFWFHKIDLDPNLQELFRSFHKDCVQRKVLRAERENLSYHSGRSEPLLKNFYDLLLLTRRRQQLPPQPLSWFRNLIDCLGDSLTIRVACKNGRPVASILTLRYRKVLVYKYGCSDATQNHLGGTQLLFWRAIEEAKADGAREFDLGRSDFDNPGLITFKDRWGSARSVLTYWRYPGRAPEKHQSAWVMRMSRRILANMPDALFTATGQLIYRHLA